MWTSAWVLRDFNEIRRDTLITRRDLLNYGSQDAVDSALRRLRKKGIIIKLAWGVYVRVHPSERAPNADAVASAKIAAFQRTQTDSALDEAHQHGIAGQGEDEIVFEVDGASSSFMVFNQAGKSVCRVFRRRKVARKTQLYATPARRAIKALWALGPETCTRQIVQWAVRNLDRAQRREFHLSSRWMPGWLSDLITASRLFESDLRCCRGKRPSSGAAKAYFKTPRV